MMGELSLIVAYSIGVITGAVFYHLIIWTFFNDDNEDDDFWCGR